MTMPSVAELGQLRQAGADVEELITAEGLGMIRIQQRFPSVR